MRSQMTAIIRLLTALFLAILCVAPARAEDAIRIQEEVWVLPLTLPMFAYLVRPAGDGPFPLVIMNHGVSLNPTHAAFTAAGGRADFHLMPPFGNEGHFFIGSPEAIPLWSPLVTKFLDAQK